MEKKSIIYFIPLIKKLQKKPGEAVNVALVHIIYIKFNSFCEIIEKYHFNFTMNYTVCVANNNFV